MANMARALEHLTMCPFGLSLIKSIISSRSIFDDQCEKIITKSANTSHVEHRALADRLRYQFEPGSRRRRGFEVNFEAVLPENVNIFGGNQLIGGCQLK